MGSGSVKVSVMARATPWRNRFIAYPQRHSVQVEVDGVGLVGLDLAAQERQLRVAVFFGQERHGRLEAVGRCAAGGCNGDAIPTGAGAGNIARGQGEGAVLADGAD